ncbi:hypothetical protein C1Y63_06895 [Corynebacterium sp. 13CS0277]|uniref:excalibur calcium-binding domain-containing protein n=1 Tax=Corynebacterium sp. 13CS0277 TaxID=2071994 RepID=UPI000D043074|nr:excalibur calcium-binding domain-containing protein [Corynebacterium sp. 13CS0277]PRQ11272.1 hypothetical protein C1Y63_06895 [Corynebacterium sp. 13CS0277]
MSPLSRALKALLRLLAFVSFILAAMFIVFGPLVGSPSFILTGLGLGLPGAWMLWKDAQDSRAATNSLVPAGSTPRRPRHWGKVWIATIVLAISGIAMADTEELEEQQPAAPETTSSTTTSSTTRTSSSTSSTTRTTSSSARTTSSTTTIITTEEPTPEPMEEPAPLPPVEPTPEVVEANVPEETPEAPVGFLAPPPEEPKPVYASNCCQAYKLGIAPMYQGNPDYVSRLDGDHDGVACESVPKNCF